MKGSAAIVVGFRENRTPANDDHSSYVVVFNPASEHLPCVKIDLFDLPKKQALEVILVLLFPGKTIR